MTSNLVPDSFDIDQKIFEPGDLADSLYIICQGLIQIEDKEEENEPASSTYITADQKKVKHTKKKK